MADKTGRWTAGAHLACFHVAADSGKRKKKGNELEQIDCTPPEHILPGSKDRPLVPLQPQNKDWKVRSSAVLALHVVQFAEIIYSLSNNTIYSKSQTQT